MSTRWTCAKQLQLPNLILIPVLLGIFLLTSCSYPLRIQSDVVSAGYLRLAQVTASAKRSEILAVPDLYKAITESGFGDADIFDGSVMAARVYCCGGMSENLSSETLDAIMVYVPKETNVTLGDIVEVRVGHPPKKGLAGQLNIVTRVVQRQGTGDEACWWDPKDDRLWLRVLYCNWMQRDGWIHKGGSSPAWVKRQASGSSGK